MMCIGFSACRTGNNPDPDSYYQELEKWKSGRVERLKSKDGWLNLAGLFWLEEGENTFGSGQENTVRFPAHAPEHIGSYTLSDGKIHFTADQGVSVTREGSIIKEIDVKTDKSGEPTLLETGNFAWFIKEQSGKFAIRLRDYEHPAIEEFHGIETYPADMDWIIEARFEAFDEPMELQIPNIIGTIEKGSCPGILHFKVGGQNLELYPTGSGDHLFLVFADETSGLETYGGGRFLYVSRPGEDGLVSIDFNRAYNPPCAFTPFATCPLPTRENFLSVSITAGEKFAGH